MLKILKPIFLTAPLFFYYGCCPYYDDPSLVGQAPSSPGTAFIKPFRAEETFERPFSAEDLSKTMPLCKLLDIALYNNPATRSSWNAARANAFLYRESLSPYYPLIGYSGNVTAQRANGLSGSSSTGGVIATAGAGSSTSLSNTSRPVTVTRTVFHQIAATYLLLDFGGRDAFADYSYHVLLASNWHHDQVMQNVILSVLDAYTNYLGNKALRISAEEDLRDAQVALDAAIKMKQAGLATATDVLSAQSLVEQQRLNLTQFRGAENTALGNFLIALGLPPDTPLQVEDLPEKLPIVEISGNISSLIEMAKAFRPDIATSIAVVNEQKALLALSYSESLPQVNLNAASSHVHYLQPRSPSVFNSNVSVDWSVPIFNGFFYVNQQRQFKEQIQQALADLDVRIAQVESDIVINYFALRTAEAAMPASDALVDYSSRAYTGQLSQYKVGSASILDVINSLNTLSNARAQKIVTRTRWAQALSNLAFSVGSLSDVSGSWSRSGSGSWNGISNKGSCCNEK